MKDKEYPVVNPANPQHGPAIQPTTFLQNPLSFITFQWFTPLLNTGFKRQLQQEDVFDVFDKIKTKNAYPQFQQAFAEKVRSLENTEQGKKQIDEARSGVRASFVSATLWKNLKGTLWLQMILYLCYSALSFAGPLFLKEIVTFLSQQQQFRKDPVLEQDFEGDRIPESRAYIFATAMLIAPLLGSICMTHSNRFGILHQLQIRAQLTAAVYRKSLKMSNQARQQTETGKIVNLMSTDINNVVNFMYPFFFFFLSGPLTIIVALILLWFQIRWATFIGLGIMLISGPAAAMFVKRLVMLRKKMLGCTDVRVKLMNQLLQGIRVLKMYAWEEALQDEVEKARSAELGCLWKIIPVRVGLQTVLFATPTLSAVASFGVYGSVYPEELTPAQVFASIALFAMIRFPLAFIQFAIIQFGNAWVSLRRINQFLMQDEYSDYSEKLSQPGIVITDGSFCWQDEVEEKKNLDAKPSTSEILPAPDESDTDSNEAIEKQKLTSEKELTSIEEKTSTEFKLQGVNIDIKQGEFVCVVGRVGCGKSSLLSAILGEMRKLQGSVGRGGSIAYVAQTAWIVNDTLKGNVTMNLGIKDNDDLDIDERFEEVIHSCCLQADIDILPGGVYTEIGEKGINLSGGQKQRVSIARAVYQDRDVYLLDDPLSAVDVHVGGHIFKECLMDVLSQKTRVLVTNQPQYLPQADKIIYIENGRIQLQGNYEECMSNIGFQNLLQEFQAKQKEVKDEVPAPEEVEARKSLEKQVIKSYPQRISTDVQKEALPKCAPQPSPPSLQKQFTLVNPQSDVPKDVGNEKEGGKNGLLTRVMTFGGLGKSNKALSRSPSGQPIKLNKGALTAAESRESGQVQVSVYAKYLKMYGLLSLVFVAMFWSIEQSIRILTNWWLARWTEKEAFWHVEGLTGKEDERLYYILCYLGFGLAFPAAVFIKACINLTSAWRASQQVHKVCLKGVVRSPMSFFDTTPIGRALNRFSRDTDDLDFNLSQSITEFGNCLFQLAATMIFIAVVQPWFIIALLPLSVIYYFVQRYFRRSSIELQRLDAVSRSPVYAHFSETLGGLETVRAYQFGSQFQDVSGCRVDDNNRSYQSMKMADEWLGFRLDIIGSSIIFVTALLAVVNRENIDAALAALALTEALDVTLFLKHAVKAAAMGESRFNAVERLLEYAELQPEAPTVIPDNRVDQKWPNAGKVVYKSISMRYREGLDPVLQSVNFEVGCGQSIGIVGRTGSGKSSLIVVLFRLVEPYQGSVEIDGVNIMGLGLHDLRSRVAAIPQDPVLFTGSLRYNLDPTDLYEDVQIWSALELAGMKSDIMDKSDKGLEMSVSESGSNFSLGQRQLLCVARALLRKPKVLAADEATASVDSETDAKIQTTIRQNFKDCTVLTIAHRLNTIMDSDKVLVMESGYVKEYDSVPNLLKIQDGVFREMVESSNQQHNN